MEEVGMIGLGRMGGNMAERLRRAGHTVVGYDPHSTMSDAGTVAEMVQVLAAPRLVWMMVPAGGATSETVETLAELLSPGDLVVDGGNSRYTDDERHAQVLGARDVGFLDCGVSGGIWGLEKGYALMCGGAQEDVARAKPVFESLQPESGAGFVHAGPTGAGHFAKMVHNGIEYGVMQALAEGWELMEKAPLVTDVREVFRSWQEGTVIRSWLLDLAVRALDDDEHLHGTRGYAEDSGEGRWTIEAAVEHAVPAPAITAALYARFSSRQDDPPAMKMVSALRKQFGGHAVSSSASVTE
jgi:6-phosphogluconate dehydrogenase